MRSRLNRFLAILCLLLFYTCYKAIELWPAHPILCAFASVAYFALMIGRTLAARADLVDGDDYLLWSWSGSLAMGLWTTFILLSIPLDAFHLMAYALFAALGKTWHWSGTFTLLARVLLSSSLVLSVLGFLQMWRGPILRRITVKIEALHPALEGLKIAHMSDLHVGPTIRKNDVRRMVARANEAEPDLVAITGDLSDATADSIAEDLEPLRGLRQKHGVFYVTGNHEYYWDPEGLVKKARELGWLPLLNENRVVAVGSAKLLVAGITDPMAEELSKSDAPNAGKAAKTSEAVDFRILLSHRPEISKDASAEIRALGFNLQLSGHTHAGQFFPFSMLIGLAHQYTRGLYDIKGLHLYVNPGTGYWGPASRLGVHSEIALLTLRKA